MEDDRIIKSAWTPEVRDDASGARGTGAWALTTPPRAVEDAPARARGGRRVIARSEDGNDARENVRVERAGARAGDDARAGERARGRRRR